MPINYNPQPRPGSYTNEYGGVPGQIEAPDPFADLERLYPNLSQTNAQASRNILSGLRGELSPETLSAIQEDAARYGITSGMPGSDLSFRSGLVRKAGAKEARQQQALNEYLALSTGINRNQILDPGLATSIADRNATYNAAPVPEDVANQLMRDFYRSMPAGGGGVTGGAPGFSAQRAGGGSLPSHSDFFSNSNPRGTGWDMPQYAGDYISPFGNGFTPGGGGTDLWGVAPQPYDPVAEMFNPGPIDYGGGGNWDWRYGVEARPNFGQDQYDPLRDYGSDYGGNIDFGMGGGGDFDPNWDY